jgi:hypothetical protein
MQQRSESWTSRSEGLPVDGRGRVGRVEINHPVRGSQLSAPRPPYAAPQRLGTCTRWWLFIARYLSLEGSRPRMANVGECARPINV